MGPDNAVILHRLGCARVLAARYSMSPISLARDTAESTFSRLQEEESWNFPTVATRSYQAVVEQRDEFHIHDPSWHCLIRNPKLGIHGRISRRETICRHRAQILRLSQCCAALNSILFPGMVGIVRCGKAQRKYSAWPTVREPPHCFKNGNIMVPVLMLTGQGQGYINT